MQTFLPFPDFSQSARVLDYRRLGKQRVEALQLLQGSWPNHPCAKMWQGHRIALARYGLAICEEWLIRGYKDSCYDKISAMIPNFPGQEAALPSWFGRSEFHIAHQSNLIRKKPEFYQQHFPNVPDNLPYIWPV